MKQHLAVHAHLGANMKNQQLIIMNLELQISQITGAQNTRTQRGLSIDTKAYPKQVNTITTRRGLQLKKQEPENVSLAAANDDTKNTNEKVIKEKTTGNENKKKKMTLPIPFT